MTRSSSERAPRAIPQLYIIAALLSTLLMALFMPPFLVSDEDAHSRRAYAMVHGHWLAHPTPQGIGAPVDASLTQVATTVLLYQARIQNLYKIASERPDGRMPLSLLQDIQPAHWSHRPTFIAFPNTATYPPTLYLPQALGWRLTEALDLSIVHSLLCVRLFTALCSIALGWLALRLGRVNPFLLAAYLLLPTVVGLMASCSQDALLVTVAALAAAVLSRSLAGHRAPHLWEWALGTILLAAIVMARPPYLPLVFTLYLPQLQWPHKPGLRSYLAPTVGVLFVLVALLAWQTAAPALASYQATLPSVDPKLQLGYLFAHPLRGTFNIVAGTLLLAPHMIIKALYSLAWNDIYPPMVIDVALMAALAGLCAVSTWQGLSRRAPQLLLAGCILSSVLALSLAEYLIWTPVAAARPEGLLARYYLPLVPFLLLFSSPGLRTSLPFAKPRWILPASSALIVLVLLTAPWLLSHRFYNAGPAAVLKATLR